MYAAILSVHNLTRWIIAIAGIFLLVKTLLNLIDKQAWNNNLNTPAKWYTSAFDIQLLLGLILFFFYSPLTKPAFLNFGMSMHNDVMRFFTLEHPGMMIISLVLAHIGRRKMNKDLPAEKKYQQILIWFGLSIILLLLAIPCHFMDEARPLIRLFNFSF